MAYYLAGPIFVTAIAGTVLREPVGWRRWSAVVAGFIGVIVCLRPGVAALTWPALIALIGSFTFSLSMISTRFLRGTSGTVLVTTQTVAALAFGAAIAPFGWVTPTVGDLALLALLGIVAMVAHVCVNRLLIVAPASTVVPYQYTTIVWAVLFGYLVFGDVPDVWMLAGGAVIIGAGLFIFVRERQLARRDAAFSERRRERIQVDTKRVAQPDSSSRGDLDRAAVAFAGEPAKLKAPLQQLRADLAGDVIAPLAPIEAGPAEDSLAFGF